MRDNFKEVFNLLVFGIYMFFCCGFYFYLVCLVCGYGYLCLLELFYLFNFFGVWFIKEFIIYLLLMLKVFFNDCVNFFFELVFNVCGFNCFF